MKYFPPFQSLPVEQSILPEIDAAAGRLNSKLSKLELRSLGISEYNQRYLGEYIQNSRATFSMYAYLLAWSLEGMDKALKDITLADYGGGCGLMSMLANEIGVGKVIYNDIYAVSCNDAQIIAIALGIPATVYHCGDTTEFAGYMQQHAYSPDIIVSFDVIEHVYNIESTIHAFSLASHKGTKLLMASGANTHNPWIRRRLMKSHFAAEYRGKSEAWGLKDRDTKRAHYDIRREIIHAYDPSLSGPLTDALARHTRGLVKGEIESCVIDFRNKGKISYHPDHPTNTCDPYTGNWSERLMDTRYLKKILEANSYKVEVKCGYYSWCHSIGKRLVKFMLNMLITMVGTKGLIFAPYYLIIASSKG